MRNWDLLLTDAHVATMREGAAPYGVIENAAIAISGGVIKWLGSLSDLPQATVGTRRSLAGRWLTPALIDCHTHLAFAGNRAAEFEQRLQGATYEEIARSGGGIMSTVNATRSAGEDELLRGTAERLRVLRNEGCATIEIKSGYGLDVETELRLLKIIRSLGKSSDISVRSTFLGAHAIPSEYKNQSSQYIDLVCDEVLPAAHANGLADAVDAYCETIAFSSDQVARVFECAQRLGIPVKLHADQLSDTGGAALAAQFGALSADHLEYSSTAGIKALASTETVAVMLPGAFLTLGETKTPPIDELREFGVRIAVASDCNPGTSPICSIRTTMSLARNLFRLTPEECLAGVTRNAAHALGLANDRGTIDIGKRADIAVWDIGHPRELSYWMGLNELSELIVAGETLRG